MNAQAEIRESIFNSRELTLALALSDVDFLRWAHSRAGALPFVFERELELYDFTLSEEAYRSHYAHHEGKFYAGPVREFLRKDWTQDTRYRKIRDYVASCIACGARRILDFGCATGHISRALAREFPQCDFVGTDVVPQAIETYNQFAPRNAEALLWQQLIEDGWVDDGWCDVVICAEVLEHVRDPYATLDTLEQMSSDDVQFVCTLPQGPWESQGWKKNPGAREHVRHWDANDLSQVFGPSALISVIVGTPTHFGIPVGHAITLSGPRVGVVDMEAKMQRYRAMAYAEPLVRMEDLR